MPEQNIIDVSWDLEKFDQQTKDVIKDMQAVYDLGKLISQQKISLGSTGGFKEIKDAVDNTNKLTDAQKKLIETQKAAAASAAALAKEKARLAQLSTDEAKQIAEVKLQQQAQVKVNKEVAASVLGLVDDYGLLKKEYNEAAAAAKNLQTIALKSGNADDKTAADLATAKAKSLHDSLLTIEQGVGQSQRNVGNYTGALKILDTALTEAKQKLDGMSASERQNTAAGQSLQKEIGLLSTLVGQQDKGFVSLRREVMNATQALATMSEQGLSNTAAFKELQTEVSNGRRSLIEFNEQQKLLSAESPKIAALTAVAKGLGAAYAIGAGASALFADGNEKVEKELNKLVAVMTLLQGLTEFNKTMQERTAIATALLGVKESILNGILAIKTFILTGSTKSQIENTAATVGGAIAEEGLAAATTAASTSMIVLRGALVATGIGAIVVLLVAAAYAMGAFSDSTDKEKESIDALNDSLDRNRESIENANKNIDFQQKLELENMKQNAATKKQVRDQEARDMQLAANKAYNDNRDNADKLTQLDAEHAEIRKKTIADHAADYAAVGAATASQILDVKLKELDKDYEEHTKKIRDSVKKDNDNADALQMAHDLKVSQNKTADYEEKIKKKHLAVVNESTKEALDIEFELYKISQQRKLKLLDEDVNDTKLSFSKKVEAAEEYRVASIELVNRTNQHEIEADKTKLSELESNLAKSKGTHRNNLLIEIENEQKTITIASAKKNDELLSIEDKFQKQQTQIVKDEQARQLKVYEDAAKSVANVRTTQGGAIEAIRATEKASHDKLLHDKVISQETYDKLEKKGTNDLLILSLQADLQKEESLRNLAIAQKKSTTDLDNSITVIKGKIISAQNGLPDKKNVPSVAESELDILRSTESAVNGLVDAKYQHEIDAIQKVIDLNNQRKDQEITNINASTLSNQEKAAQLIILDKTVAANNHKLAMEQYRIKLSQAKFDRDAAIAEILQNAIIAEFKLPAQAGFAGIAAGIAIGVAATAQIAMLLARPLPTPPAYAKGIGIPGQGEHPGGPAIVGEAGMELVSPAGGKPFMAYRPMLLNNLPAGSKVFPSDIMTAANMSATMMINERYGVTTTADKGSNDRALIEAMYDVGRMTTSTMRKQKGSVTNIIINTDWHNYINKNVKG